MKRRVGYFDVEESTEKSVAEGTEKYAERSARDAEDSSANFKKLRLDDKEGEHSMNISE